MNSSTSPKTYRYSWPADLVEHELLGRVRNAASSARASDSGMNGLEKSRRLSPPIRSSTRQFTRSATCSVA